jgi:NAD(P)H dehydrogenase (quinone)
LRIAVTGAGGQLGGQVVELLAAEEAHEVVAVSRREPTSAPQLRHVTGVAADYADPVALRAALRGVETLVFVSSDGETAKVVLHHQNVVRAAADSGVAHIVALSGLDADLTSPFCYGVTYGHTEQLLDDSGCSVSIARASIFTEFFMRWLTRARASGQIRLPAADGRISRALPGGACHGCADRSTSRRHGAGVARPGHDRRVGPARMGRADRVRGSGAGRVLRRGGTGG